MVRLRLLLSPVRTVVKAAHSELASRPNPTQKGKTQMLGLWKNIGLTNLELSSSVRSLVS